jgi:hypothetical protein
VRTTLSLDDDVIQRARTLAQQLNKPFRFVINEALRSGLANFEQTKAKRKPYKTKPVLSSPLQPGVNIDNIGELLSQIEGEDYR